MRRQLAFAAAFVLGTAIAAAAVASPDKRSWDEVTHDFVTGPADAAMDGGQDGQRLRELDPKRAAAFLLPFLTREQPHGLRLKAIKALGNGSFKEAIPALSAIAMDTTEAEDIRYSALNPGLRYMYHPEAIRTASALVNDKAFQVRSAAFWVLSDNGSDAAVSVLAERLRVKDPQDTIDLINAIAYAHSRNPKAGKILFDQYRFRDLVADEKLLIAYASAMSQCRIPDARQMMLEIALYPEEGPMTIRPTACDYALGYFESFPCKEVVPVLIESIAKHPRKDDFFTTVTAFLKSDQIPEADKQKLAALITSGKVQKPEPMPEP